MIKDDKNIKISKYEAIQEKPQKRVNKKKTNQIDVYHLKNEKNNYQTIVLINSI